MWSNSVCIEAHKYSFRVGLNNKAAVWPIQEIVNSQLVNHQHLLLLLQPIYTSHSNRKQAIITFKYH